MTSITTEQRAVLFRVGGLGDLLVALPAIALARRRLPDQRLALVGREEYAALLVRTGIVDEAMAFDDRRIAAIFAHHSAGRGDGADKGSSKHRTGSDIGSESPNGHDVPVLAGVSLAMGWWNRRGDWPADEWWGRQGINRTCFVTYDSGCGQPLSRYFFDQTMGFFGKSSPAVHSDAFDDHEESKVLWVSEETRAGRQESSTGRWAGSRELIAVGSEDTLFDECALLRLPPASIQNTLAALGLHELGPGEKRLVVHPGSGGRAKRWPLPNFIEVVRRAASLGVNGVLVTGEAEEDLESSLEALALPAGWAWISRLPAEALAGLVASSTHYIGNDSGPTHLAAACGARVLAFFRDDNLAAWRPYGRTRVLSAPSLEYIPLAAALPLIDDFLAC